MTLSGSHAGREVEDIIILPPAPYILVSVKFHSTKWHVLLAADEGVCLDETLTHVLTKKAKTKSDYRTRLHKTALGVSEGTLTPRAVANYEQLFPTFCKCLDCPDCPRIRHSAIVKDSKLIHQDHLKSSYIVLRAA
jgi:hypothetical protein